MTTEKPVKIQLKALKDYIDRIGGTIIIEGNNVEVFIPVEVEEVAGGIQYHIKGRIEDNDIIIETCVVNVETGRVASIDIKDLLPWLKYISERFGE